jgi:eukaryotic-like serine/threonine-protein kinase
VMKCLEKEPSARFQTMDELLEAMRQATAGQGLSGIFVDPRIQNAAGQVHRTSTPVHPVVHSATPHSLPMGEPIDIEISGVAEAKKVSTTLVMAVASVVVVGAILGGLVAYKSHRKTAVVEPAALGARPPQRLSVPTSVDVRFEIDSVPQGARVMQAGQDMGATPLALTLPRTGADPVQVELALMLDGYEASSVVAQGSDGVVRVMKALTRKAPDISRTTPKAPKKAPKTAVSPSPSGAGYKDDPY